MSMLFAYMAGGEGLGVGGFKMICREGQNFSTSFVCVWGGGVRFSTSPSVKKITDSPLIDIRLVPITKRPIRRLSFLRYFLFSSYS